MKASLTYYIIALVIIYLVQACASVQAPPGGPEDNTIPKLLSVNPPPGTTSIQIGQKFEFLFDERIEAPKLYQEMIVSPFTEAEYEFVVSKKKLVFKFEDELDSNTTYTLNFREGVTDITAKNPIENLNYAFSTGSIIDSLFIHGEVTHFLTEKAVEKVNVSLYKLTDTLNLTEDNPTYFTKTDSAGHFLIQNIKKGEYLIQAFLDADKNSIYSQYKEEIGFIADTLTIDSTKEEIKIRLGEKEFEPLQIINTKDYKGTHIIAVNNPISDITVKDKDSTLITYFDTKENEIHIFYDTKDSTQLSLSITDTIQQQIDTTLSIYFSEDEADELKFKMVTTTKNLKYTNDSIIVQYKSTYPIYNINHSLFYAYKDSSSIDTLSQSNFTLSPDRLSFTVRKAQKALDTLYIRYDTAAVISVKQDTISSGKKLFLPYQEEKYGTLNGLIVTDYPSFNLQLINNSNKIERSIWNQKAFTIKELPSGEYTIRIYIDENENKRYDLSNYTTKTQAEKIYNYPGKIKVKANWEISLREITF
ncbi:MAG: Ig-like domain-containing protein [Cyclobacteriaceae bacterium]